MTWRGLFIIVLVSGVLAGPLRAQAEEDAEPVPAPPQALDLDVWVSLQPHRLEWRKLFHAAAGKLGIRFGRDTCAVAVVTEDPVLQEMVPRVRQALLRQLENEDTLAGTVELDERVLGRAQGSRKICKRAGQRGANVVLLATLARDASGDPVMRTELRNPAGQRLTSRMAEGFFTVHRYRAYRERVQTLVGPPAQPRRTLEVVAAGVPAEALLADPPEGPVKVGVVVQAEDPALAEVLPELELRVKERLAKVGAVGSLAVFSQPEDVAGRSDTVLAQLAGAQGCGRMVVVRLEPSADGGAVVARFTALGPDGLPRAVLFTERAVVVHQAVSEAAALEAFRRRALRTRMQQEIWETRQTYRYGNASYGSTVVSRQRVDRRIVVGQDDLELSAAAILEANPTATNKEVLARNARMESISFKLMWGWLLAPVIPVGTALLGGLVGMLAGGTGMAVAAAGGSSVGGLLLAAGLGAGAGLLVGLLAGGVVGLVPAAAVALPLRMAQTVATMNIKSLPESAYVEAVNMHNAALARELGVDPLAVDDAYFPEG